MASRLLNSGDLKNYFAIGEDGVLVWQRADAFRSSIITSEQLGQKYADYLAVPRFTADGSHVDWFIPFAADNKQGEYSVVAWPAASPDEKKAALEELNRLNEKFLNYGYNLHARALNANDRLFAHFLTGSGEGDAVNPAIHFPDEECVYIVNGRPVITFWGFLNRGDTLSGDPFSRLRGGVVPPVTPRVAPAAVAAANHKWCWFLLPLLLLLLPLLAYLLWWWFFARVQGLPLFKTYPDISNLSLDPVKESLVAPDKEKIIRLKDGSYVRVDSDGKETVIPAAEAENLKLDDAIASDEPKIEEPVADSEKTAEEPVTPPAEDNTQNPVHENLAKDDNPVQTPEDNTNTEQKADEQNNQNVPVPPELSEDNQNASPAAQD